MLLLALLLFRAYVPVGFMPASGVPFALELCPSAMAGMPAHAHHHGATHADFESCPFGSAPGAGPISHHIVFASAGPAPVLRMAAVDTLPAPHRPQRTHQPRGPPALALS
jgi:hypothetical protein